MFRVRYFTAFSTLFLFFCAIAPASQVSAASIGIKGGLNLSKVTGTFDYQGQNISFDEWNYKRGGRFGLFANIGIGGSLYLQPELAYSAGGALREFEQTFYDKIYGKLQYLEIPLLVKYSLPLESESAGIFVIAGPAVAVLIEAEVEVSGENFTRLENIKNDIKDWDIGFAAGIGADLRISDEVRIITEIRYTAGLMDINDSEYFTADQVKNRNISVTAGLIFPLKKN